MQNAVPSLHFVEYQNESLKLKKVLSYV